MPLTDKGNKIMGNMQKEYGNEKGKRVFYASQNKGTISGTDPSHPNHPAHHAHMVPHLKRAGHTGY